MNEREPDVRSLASAGPRRVRISKVASVRPRKKDVKPQADFSGRDACGSVASLSSLLGIAERVDKLLAVRRKSSQEQEKEHTHEDMAAAFALVDARIVELACELAATMVDPAILAGRDPEARA